MGILSRLTKTINAMTDDIEKIPASDIFRRALVEFNHERSVLDIALTFFRLVFRIDFNFITTVVVLFFIFFLTAQWDEKKLFIGLDKLLDSGLSYSTTTFGFLLTGISLVAAITRKKFFVFLASHYRKSFKMSELKYAFILFFYTISAFVLYIFIVLLLRLVSPVCFADFLYSCQALCGEQMLIVRLLYVFLATFTVYLCLLLKSLAWNLYRVYVDVILVELK